MTPLAPPFAPTDALGAAFHSLRMSGSYYCRSDFTEPWGLELPPMEGCLWFHVLTSGRCWLEVDGAEPLLLQPRDLALVPHGDGHVLRSEPGVRAPSVMDLHLEQVGARYEILRHGGGGAPATMICCAVRFQHPAAIDLVRLLPQIICVDALAAPDSERLQSTVMLMVAEAGALRLGGETVVTRLADILVVQVIRSWIEHDPAAQTGWLGALRDSQIGRAISLIHQDPSREWSVASLANELAMSRSAFAARFTELVGEPAMHYIRRWRMNTALGLLREGPSVAEVAARLGYQSEAAFNRAFKRVTGVTPGSIRQDDKPPMPGAAYGPTNGM